MHEFSNTLFIIMWEIWLGIAFFDLQQWGRLPFTLRKVAFSIRKGNLFHNKTIGKPLLFG